jgi:hypothetical protein
MMKVNNVSLKF